jgi:hypothetical protein
MQNTDDFINKIKEKIDNDKIASFIWIFDHYNHTKKIWGDINDNIIDWKIIVFCFGQELPKAEVMWVRPRNIAIAEFDNKFVISFSEAPKEQANEKMSKWILDEINS